MKIGYIYDLQIVPPKGGNHVHALELVNGFLDSGHQVGVLGDPTVAATLNFDESKSGLDSLIEWLDILYVRVDARLFSDWEAINYCSSVIKNKPVVWEINAPANETYAYSYYGGLMHWDRKQEPVFKQFKRRVHALKKLPGVWKEEHLRKKLAKKADAAVCVSKALASYSSKGLGIQNSQVLPNGGPFLSQQEIESRRAGREKSEFRVLYSGSAIYPWQGLNFLVEAIKLAEVEMPDVQFVLAINQLVDDLPDGQNVEIKVGLNRDSILDEICQADLCVAIHPEYFWSRWKFHGSPMKMFEYMGCGTAVLASNIGQMRDLLTHGKDGFLTENNPRSILNTIAKAKEDEELLAMIAMNGWEQVQNSMSWEKNVKKTLELFESLLVRYRGLP